MTLKEICRGVISLAEAAERLAPGMLKYPHRDDVGNLSAQDRAALHRGGVSCHDFAVGVSHAFRSLSPATIEHIKHN
jgi:hypothetical protein